MKKGDSNMWWIIIGAVIALIVLVVLLVIFTGKTNILETELLSCQSKGGRCVDPGVSSENACEEACNNKFGESRTYSSTFTCPKVGETRGCCCLGVGDGSPQ